MRTRGQTGVEMEALTAVAVAALTIYDMLKAVDGMVIGDIRLDGEARREERRVSAGPMTIGIASSASVRAGRFTS